MSVMYPDLQSISLSSVSGSITSVVGTFVDWVVVVVVVVVVDVVVVQQVFSPMK